MKSLRLSVPRDAIAPASTDTRGRLINVQLLPDGTLLELALVDAPADAVLDEDEGKDEDEDEDEACTETEQFAREVVPTTDGRTYVYQHCRPTPQVRALFDLLNAHRLMVVFPITVESDGRITLEIIGSESAVQNGFEALPPAIRDRTTVERVGAYEPTDAGVRSALTDRQRDVLDAATVVGYYDVPRRGTAADVAAAVGCAPSTASEHLRKIEATVLSAIADD